MGNMLELELSGMVGSVSSVRLDQLTPRQLEVLKLLCEGLSNKLIGRRLGISSATVKLHVASILRALQVSSRLQAVIVARKLGLGDEAPAVKAVQRDAKSEHLALDLLRLILGDDAAARLLSANSQSLSAAARA